MEQMYAYKCTKCGKLHHPHYVVCQNPDCDGREFEPRAARRQMQASHLDAGLQPAGRLYEPWLHFGVVEFENGVRATGQIGFDDGIESGMELIANVGVVRTRRILYKESIDCEEYGFVFARP